MQSGDTVRFLPGREGIHAPGMEVVVKETMGANGEWFTADIGKSEWFMHSDRVEVV